MAATTLLFADNASTTLASSITAGATSCTLAPGTGALFPNPGANQAFPMSFVDAATGLVTEVVKVTATSGDNITTMIRGQEGTSARAWLAGDLASNFWTAGALGAGSMAQIGPLQQGTYGYAVDSGSANTVLLTLSPAITSYVDGLPINFKAAANNTGATTINVNGVGAVALQGAVGALQGGEIVAGKTYEGNYNSTSNTFVLVGQGGGAEQVAPATASQHAVQLGQVSGVVGQTRRARMNTSAGVTSATVFAADEIVVETALGGLRYCLANYSQTINLATTGAGGMDTGTAPTSGYVALYAIYNPTTNTQSILATNATASVVGNVYGGANMPAGYTASALISVWPTNASKLFVVGVQFDRIISLAATSILSSSVTQASPIALSISSAVPPNAITVSGTMAVASTAASNLGLSVFTSAASTGQQGENFISTAAGASVAIPYRDLQITTSQNLFYSSTSTAGTPTFSMGVTGYSF